MYGYCHCLFIHDLIATTVLVVNFYCDWVWCIFLWLFYFLNCTIVILILLIVIITILVLMVIKNFFIDMGRRCWIDWCNNGGGSASIIKHYWGIYNTTVIRIGSGNILLGSSVSVSTAVTEPRVYSSCSTTMNSADRSRWLTVSFSIRPPSSS